MKVGLWSDSTKFPSLPLMKLSAYHKSIGDEVEFIHEGSHYDKAYVSKVFNLPNLKRIPYSPPKFTADEVLYGGTGYAIDLVDGVEVFQKERHENLPSYIENLYPDYSLYPESKQTSYGFLTRGCCNNCGFCLVSKKEGLCSHKVADLEEFHRNQQVIKLMDPNLLACRDRSDLLNQLIESRACVDFTQGLDARFINKDTMDALNRMKLHNVHFAFDLMKHEEAILKGLSYFVENYHKSHWNLSCYILTNYNTTLEEDWYRVRRVMELGLHPYVMIYQKGTHPKFLTDLSRWSNNRLLFKSTTFHDYIPRKDGRSCQQLYGTILSA